jgi:hypothetical protein
MMPHLMGGVFHMRTGASSIALAGGLLLAICGLGANAQDQNSKPPSFSQTYDNAVAQARQKCHELWSDHAFDSLRTKIELEGEKPNFKMLTNTQRFLAKDKPTGDLAIQTLEECRKAWAPVYSMLPAQVNVVALIAAARAYAFWVEPGPSFRGT